MHKRLTIPCIKMVTTNKIIDIYDGHFQLILDFPDKSVLYKIIDTNYKYVWLFDHVENGVEYRR